MPDFDFSKRTAVREKQWAEMMGTLENRGIKRIDIWGDKAPVHPLGNGFKAGLYLFPVTDNARGLFIICAGGAFLYKSRKEALPVADFFHDKGFNTAILDYSVSSKSPKTFEENNEIRLAAGNDALRAIRYLRAHADELGIPADKIAIGGFSAGGMTSQLAMTRWDLGNATDPDPVERVSSRPDAALLLYGAFSSTTTVGGLGYDIEKQNIMASIDPIRNIRTDCPPTFIFQTHEDDPRCGLNFAMELASRGIPYEIHTFINGEHGGGLYDGLDETPNIPHTAQWATLAAEWLSEIGF